MEVGQNKRICHIPMMMRLITSKYGDLLSYFDKIDESENGVKRSSQNKILIDNFEDVANRVIVESHLPLEIFFKFYRTFGNILLVFISISKLRACKI